MRKKDDETWPTFPFKYVQDHEYENSAAFRLPGEVTEEDDDDDAETELPPFHHRRQDRNRRSVNFRLKEKEILDSILGKHVYDSRIRPGGGNGTGATCKHLYRTNPLN